MTDTGDLGVLVKVARDLQDLCTFPSGGVNGSTLVVKGIPGWVTCGSSHILTLGSGWGGRIFKKIIMTGFNFQSSVLTVSQGHERLNIWKFC